MMCPVCSRMSAAYSFISRDRMFQLPGTFEVWRCHACDSSFLWPQLSEQQLSRFYPKKKYYAYQSGKGGFFQKVREYLIEHYYEPNFFTSLLKVPAIPQQKEGGKVLDLGCGTGETLLLLNKIGWDVYGMDMDNEALIIAKSRGLTNLRKGKFRDLKNYPDNFFDAIRLYHVIEHLDNPILCLELIQKKLRKGGEVIIGTPNNESFLSKVFGTYWYNLDSPRHLMVFNPKSLTKLIKQVGFKINSVEFCSAGGLLGSIQYLMEEKRHKNVDLIHNTILVLLVYLVEWVLDKLSVGDIFVLRATKA